MRRDLSRSVRHPRYDEVGPCRAARRIAFDLRDIHGALDAVEICVALNRGRLDRRAWERRVARMISAQGEMARLAPTARLRRYHDAVAAATRALREAVVCWSVAAKRAECARRYAAVPR